MKNRIITISREFGSGGRSIGKLLAQKLSINCYDNQIIDRIAQESGFSKEYVNTQSETAPQSSILANPFFYNYTYSTNQDYMWNIQRNIVLELAEKESCIIVGRCADYILKDIADCLTVFIHADMQKRSERIVKLYGENSVSPIKRLKDKDKSRSAYYKLYTDMEWGNIRNYQIALNSGILGISKCVDIISQAY